MAHAARNRKDILTVLQEQRRLGVAQVVQSHTLEVVVVTEGYSVGGQARWTIRFPSEIAGNGRLVGLLDMVVGQRAPPGFLLFPQERQRVLVERDLSRAASGFRFLEFDARFARIGHALAYLRKRYVDSDFTCFHIDIAPGESANLASAHACCRNKSHSDDELPIRATLQELVYAHKPFFGEGMLRLAFLDRRPLEKFERVLGNQFEIDGMFEGRLEHAEGLSVRVCRQCPAISSAALALLREKLFKHIGCQVRQKDVSKMGIDPASNHLVVSGQGALGAASCVLAIIHEHDHELFHGDALCAVLQISVCEFALPLFHQDLCFGLVPRDYGLV